MALTYVALAKTNLGASQANVEFTTIAGTYTDLVLICSPRGDAANSTRSMTMQFNANATGYSDRRAYGTGAAVAGDNNVYGTDEIYLGEAASAGGTASTFSSIEIYIPNYAGSSHKTVSISSVSEQAATTAFSQIITGLWANTDAITSIKLFIQSGSFASGSTFDLYGIKNS